MGSKVITSVFYVLIRPWLEHLGVPDIHLGGHDMSAPDIDLLLLFSNLILGPVCLQESSFLLESEFRGK